MRKVKWIALVLALVMILPTAFSGCSKADNAESGKDAKSTGAAPTEKSSGSGKNGGNTGMESTETEGGETLPDDVYDPDNIRDLDGHEFWFLVRSTGVSHLEPNEVFAAELTGEKINDAVFKRNAQLEADFNCTIHEERNPDPVKAVQEQLLAGEYQYDYIYASVHQLRQLSAKNVLVDYNSLDSLDLTKPWWDMNAMEGMSVANKIFYATGDAGTMDDRGSWVIYVNRDIVARARLRDPYELVREGKWTVEKMYEYMDATKEDLDGDGVYTIGTDRFGYIGEWQNNYFHIASFNIHIAEYKNGDIKIPATVSDELLDAWAALKPVLASPFRDVSDSGSRFRSDKGTFFGCNLGVLFAGSLNQIDFGVLPMPKLNEEQEYYWTSPHFSITFGYAIPTTTDQATDAEANGFDSGREQAGYFLEAFSAYSRETLTEAFYEQVMKHQMVQDSETVEMLELALSHKHYDVVGLFDIGKLGRSLFGEVGCGVATDTKGFSGTDVNYDNLVSTYEARVNAARKALNNYINYVTIDG